MRILLVVPYQYHTQQYLVPNLGLGYLASALRSKGHEVTFLNCLKESISDSTWKGFLSERQYEVVGIQMFTNAYHIVKGMFKVAKEALPDVINVVGGAHANVLPDQILTDCPEIDYVIHGEGEVAFPKLLDLLENNDVDKTINVSNVAWRNNGKIQVNERSFIEDLDNIDLPAWDLMDPRTYPALSHGLFNRAWPIAPIFSSRGCPYQCTFCSAYLNMGHRIRKRSPSKIVDEIEMLVSEYGVKEIHFEDDNFTFHKDFASEVCQIIIDRKIKVFWACPNGVRLDSLDAELLKLMERSGCYSFTLGVESGSDRILKLMKKNTSVAQLCKKIRLISEVTKIRMTGSFVLGYPGEEEEDLKKTEALILSEPLDRISAALCVPYPATEVYKNLVKEKKMPEKYNWELLSHHAEDQFVAGPIGRERYLQFLFKLYLKFYLRPKIILRILSELHSLRQVKVAIRIFFSLAGISKWIKARN